MLKSSRKDCIFHIGIDKGRCIRKAKAMKKLMQGSNDLKQGILKVR